MAVRLIKVITDRPLTPALQKAIKELGVIDVWSKLDANQECSSLSVLSSPALTQEVINIVQTHLGAETRIIIQVVEATIPRVEEEAKKGGEKTVEEVVKPISHFFKCATISREELFEDIASNSELSVNFVFMSLLAALVASMGVLYQNYVVLIGAMLIAPLLGPNLGLAFGTAIGNLKLIRESAKSSVVGFGAAIAFSFVIGLVWFRLLGKPPLTAHLHVGFDSILLALAAGAAAVVTLLSGVSSSLVGVMVAVALMPPATEIGLGLSIGYYAFALSSFLLLLINVVCIILSGNVLFVFSGIYPTLWVEKQLAKRASKILIYSLLVMLIVLIVLLYLHLRVDAAG